MQVNELQQAVLGGDWSRATACLGRLGLGADSLAAAKFITLEQAFLEVGRPAT